MVQMTYTHEGRLIERSDLLPCPKCGGTDLDVLANVVECMTEECDHQGPFQDGPEFACDWRWAIVDWNTDPIRAP